MFKNKIFKLTYIISLSLISLITVTFASSSQDFQLDYSTVETGASTLSSNDFTVTANFTSIASNSIALDYSLSSINKIPAQYCGDNIIQSSLSEICEPTNLNGQTCQSLGFTGGTLSCGTCTSYDTSLCSTTSTSSGGSGGGGSSSGGTVNNSSNLNTTIPEPNTDPVNPVAPAENEIVFVEENNSVPEIITPVIPNSLTEDTTPELFHQTAQEPNIINKNPEIVVPAIPDINSENLESLDEKNSQNTIDPTDDSLRNIDKLDINKSEEFNIDDENFTTKRNKATNGIFLIDSINKFSFPIILILTLTLYSLLVTKKNLLIFKFFTKKKSKKKTKI